MIGNHPCLMARKRFVLNCSLLLFSLTTAAKGEIEERGRERVFSFQLHGPLFQLLYTRYFVSIRNIY